MNRQELELFTELLKIGTSIQALYNKLYNLEINDKKDDILYLKTLGILEDAIDIERMAYFKNRKNITIVDHLIHFINNSVIQLEMPNSLSAKNAPLTRIYFRLFDLTYDIDYQRSCYDTESIEKIEEYENFEKLFNREVEEKYQQLFMQKELISGMLNKFSKMINKRPFKTSDVIEQKYLYSYFFSYIEPVFLSNKFDDNYEYPLMLKEADYLMVNRELYENNKRQMLANESGRVMVNLLYENQDKIPFLMDKAYFQYIVEAFSLEDLAELDNVYNTIKDNPLKGYKFSPIKSGMVKKIISKAINKKLDEYDLEKYAKKL